jgi:hypothetical protein
MNVGPAVERYLDGLGIRSIEQLANRDPDELFRSLSRRIGCACDPCLHDTFSAIVYEARMGTKTPWFTWTAARKRRVAAGELQLGPARADKAQRARRVATRITLLSSMKSRAPLEQTFPCLEPLVRMLAQVLRRGSR